MKENFFSYVTQTNLKNFCIYQDNKKATFSDITHLSDLLSNKIKINKTNIIGIISSNTLESAMTYFAIKKLGLVPVIIPMDDVEKGIDYLNHIGCSSFLSSEIDLDTSNLKNKDFYKIINVSKNIELFKINDEGNNSDIKMEGDILLTSGTSGTKKGVFISNQSIFSTINYISSIMKINKSYKEFLGVPFFHSFGLARLRMAIFHGADIYIPKNNTDLAEAVYLIKFHKLNIASFVPASIEMFHKFFSKKVGDGFFSLKKIELGSAKINHESLKWISSICNNATIYHHYGMTEASRTAFRIYNSSTKFIMGSKEKYVSRPDAKLSLRNNNDKQMTGELSIEGEHTFSGYVTNSDDLKVLKTNQLCESDDIIELHNSGAFSIHGKSNLIAKKGGKKISLIELENSIEKINGIERSLCYVSGESIRGDVISCNLELKKNRFSSAIKEIVLKELTAINSATPDKINIVDNISLTFNGKKKRGNFV